MGVMTGNAPTSSRTAGLRRASLAALALLLIQYGIGTGVNLDGICLYLLGSRPDAS